jgi:hypothetical protein
MVHNLMRVMAFSSVFGNDHHSEINRLAIYDASVCLYRERLRRAEEREEVPCNLKRAPKDSDTQR